MDNNEKLENNQPEVLVTPNEMADNTHSIEQVNNQLERTEENVVNNEEPKVEVSNVEVGSLPSEPVNPSPVATNDVEDNIAPLEETKQPSGEIPNNEPNVTPTNNENPNEKSNTKINIVIIAVLVVLLFVAAFVFVLPNIIGEKKNDKKEEKKEEPTPVVEKFDIKNISGTYEIDDKNIDIYIIDDDRAYMRVYSDNEDVMEYDLEINGNKLVDDMIDTNIEVSEGTEKDSIKVNFKENNETLEYEKIGEYSKDDYYVAKYGNIDYLTSSYSGIYKNDKKTIYLLQIDEDTVRVCSKEDYSLFDIEMTIQDGKLVEEFLDDTYEIVFTKEGITFTTIVGKISEMDGNYEKIGDLTQDDVFENFDF